MSAAAKEHGLDLSGEGGVEEEKPQKDEEKPKRGRPTKAAGTRDLKTRIAETIGELAEWCEKMGDAELAEILRDDGGKMAAWLAYHAEKRQRIAKALGRLFGEGSVLGFGRAYGRLLRALQQRIGEVLPRPQIVDVEPEREEDVEQSGDGFGP